jgi:hypothetical protein
MLITATLWRWEFAPSDIVRALANLWNLGLLLAAAITLLCFLYWVFLKKFLRARRIANIRLHRLMRERGSEGGDHH